MRLRFVLSAGALALSASTAISYAAEQTAENLWVDKHFHFFDTGSSGPEAVDPAAIYSNVTTFGSAGARALGATAAVPVTNLLADDLTVTGGATIASYKFSVANFNTAATTARMRVRFYDSSGAGGGPGALLSAISFNPTSIGTGVTTFNTGPLGALSFAVPSGTIWGGVFFDNVGATATTVAELNNLGLGVFNPPDVGSSFDRDFSSGTNAGNPYAANPAGSIRNSPFTANPIANYGFELVAVPEPSSLALAGLGVAGLVRRRRRA